MKPATLTALAQSLRHIAGALEAEAQTEAQPTVQVAAAPQAFGGMGAPPQPAAQHIEMQVAPQPAYQPPPPAYQPPPPTYLPPQAEPVAAPPVPAAAAPVPAAAAPAQPAEAPEQPGATLDDVHRLIGTIAQTADDGLQGRLAQLIASYGASAISGIDPQYYPELMARARDMADAA